MIGVYMRVSTEKQDSANQEPDLHRLVGAREGCEPFRERAWDAAAKYVETESAVKQRPEFDRLLEDCRTGKVRKLYVWSLDRLGRSMFENIRVVQDLVRWHVQLVSVRDPWLEQVGETGTGSLLLGVLSWVAQHERERLQFRTRAGLDRARKAGKALGRPKVVIPDKALAKACELRRERSRARGQAVRPMSWRDIVRELERLGLGRWAHGTLAAECRKRVPELERGKPGFPAAGGWSARTSRKGRF